MKNKRNIKMKTLPLNQHSIKQLLETGRTVLREPVNQIGKGSILKVDYNLFRLNIQGDDTYISPPHQIGDELAIQEKWGAGTRPCPFEGCRDGIEYRADESFIDELEDLPLYPIDDCSVIDLEDYSGKGWQPAHTMPEEFSRLTIRVSGVKAQNDNGKWFFDTEFRLLLDKPNN